MRFEVQFEKSASALGDLPRDGVPEVALIGRSNVGKSSLLNALAGRKQLARTSRTPGRTRLLNLFLVNGGQLRLVDCPGYGYAQAARSLRAQWGAFTQSYLELRAELRLVVLLVDARLEPQAIDLEACSWLREHGRELQLAATKWDRLSGNQRSPALRRLAAVFTATPLGFSAITGEGCAGLQSRLLAEVGQPG